MLKMGLLVDNNAWRFAYTDSVCLRKWSNIYQSPGISAVKKMKFRGKSHLILQSKKLNSAVILQEIVNSAKILRMPFATKNNPHSFKKSRKLLYF